MARDIKRLIQKMTLQEKVSFCSGHDFWHLKGIERLGIPSIRMSDGPHGLRKQEHHLDIYHTPPATCYPSAAGVACSWDRDLIEDMGQALGLECRAENVDILLGPGTNIKRSPLCGRNFEYFSEDPFLSSHMAAHFIKGVQSQGVGTSLKHFAANNQEYRRMTINAVIDERTLREIYLTSFEYAVKESQPWTVMAAYNQVNGFFATENKPLLTNILKDEWGFEGIVISDWGAINERVAALHAGLELEMPASYGIGEKKLLTALRKGELSEKVLDQALERILRIIFQVVDQKTHGLTYDKNVHHHLARKIARESMVLLKNDDHILPLQKDQKIAVIGSLAEHPRYQGGGSSHVTPTTLDSIIKELRKAAGNYRNILYAKGYNIETDRADAELIQKAKGVARQADVAVLFLGLPERYESEGYDREHLHIPETQVALVETIAQVQSNLVVVLSNGAPIDMPWLSRVKGLLEAYLGGQALGGAVADLLYGYTNPSGKLAETFPKKLSDTPSYLHFPGEGDHVEYREGVFVGYRYYDTKQVEPLFPFGYGLSYTTFDYTQLSVSKKIIKDTATVDVKVSVKNTGRVTGKEIVQLYVKDVESQVRRPEKELKGFEKIELHSGEEKTIMFTLDKRAFAYYNVTLQDWYVETGDFDILIGTSSKDIKLKDTITVTSTVSTRKRVTRNTTVGELLENHTLLPIVLQLLNRIKKLSFFPTAEDHDGNADDMMSAMIKNMPLRGLVNFSQGAFTDTMLNVVLRILNQEIW